MPITINGSGSVTGLSAGGLPDDCITTAEIAANAVTTAKLGTSSVELALKDVPEGVPYEIVDAADIPSDRTFRNAWVIGDGCVEHDLDQCKAIGHDIRRQQRSEEFQPFDEIIAKQIPGADALEAEAARQEIRDKYADVQVAIDAAADPDEIKAALEVTP